MSERFVFSHHPSVTEIADKLDTTKGRLAIEQISVQFTSLAQAIRHTQAVGDSSIVHLPDGQHISLINLPKHDIARAFNTIVGHGDATFF